MDVWASDESVKYTGFWSTLASGDKVTKTSGDTCRFTFEGTYVVKGMTL